MTDAHWVRAVHFFHTLRLHSRPMLAGLASLGLLGGLVLLLDPTRGVEVTLPVVVVQMFAASSGFLVPARRGHFDLLLTVGPSRRLAAAAHWAVSAAPGLVLWLGLGCLEAALGGGGGAALASGTVAAMALVSLLGWAGTVALPRLGAGVIWLVLMAALLATTGQWPGTGRMPLLGELAEWPRPVQWTVCPLLMVGLRLDDAGCWSAMPGLVLAVAGWWVAVLAVERASLGLEAAQ